MPRASEIGWPISAVMRSAVPGAAGLDLVGQAVDPHGALGGGQPRPRAAVESLARGTHRTIDVFVVAVGGLTDDRVIERILDGEPSARRGGDLSAGEDAYLKLRCFGHAGRVALQARDSTHCDYSDALRTLGQPRR